MRRATEQSGGDEESECVDSTDEVGERNPEGPGGGRRRTGVRELLEGQMPRTLTREGIKTKQEQIAKLSSYEPKMALRTLGLCCKPDEGARWSGRVTCSP